MTDLRYRFLGLALLALAFALPAFALAPQGGQRSAQDPVARQEGADESQQSEAPGPIAPANIQAEAETTLLELSSIEAEIADEAEFEGSRQTLDGLRTQFEAAGERFGGIDEDTVVARRIDDASNAWSELQGRVAAPVAIVRARYEVMQGQLATLEQSRRQWLITLDGLAAAEGISADVAADLRGRATQVLGSIEDTRLRLQERADEALALQNDLATLSTEIGQNIIFLSQLAADLRRRVLTRDATPFWGVGPDDATELGGEARDALGDRIVTVRRFFTEHPGQAGAHLIAFLVFVAIGFAMRRQMHRWKEIAGTESLRSMLSRPISLAAIFALLAGSWFYAAAPASLVDIFLLVTLVPVMRLAPRLLAAEVRPALYGLLGLYAAVRLVNLMMPGSGLQRLSLLLLATLAVVGLVRFVRRHLKLLTEGKGASWKLAGFLKRLAIPVLIAAVVANLLGWVRLSSVITSASVASAYAAVILWLFAAGASGIVAVLPMTRLGDVLPSLRRNAPDVTRVLTTVVRITALWIWIDATLTWFLLRAPAAGWLRAIAAKDLGLGGFQITAGDIVAAVLVLIIAPLISRLVRFFFMEELCPRLSLPRGAADGVASLMHYTIITVGALVAATAAGFNATQLTVVFGALGVGIGFGLQNIVGNFISGLILIFERPISVGDRIAVGANQQVGVVKRIGIRASTVRTFDGSEILVPNSDLISKEVVNWTLSDMQRRLEMKLNVEYGTDPRRILELLTRVAEEHPDVLSEPPAAAVFDGFGESWLAFRLLYWVPGEGLLRIKTEMSLAVNDALNAAEVRIAVPRRRVEIRDAGEGAKDQPELLNG